MVKVVDFMLELLVFWKLYWLPWTVSVYYLCYHICICEVFHTILLLVIDKLLTRYLYAYVIVCLGLKHLHIIGNIDFVYNCHEVLVSTNPFRNISICEHRYSKQIWLVIHNRAPWLQIAMTANDSPWIRFKSFCDKLHSHVVGSEYLSILRKIKWTKRWEHSDICLNELQKHSRYSSSGIWLLFRNSIPRLIGFERLSSAVRTRTAHQRQRVWVFNALCIIWGLTKLRH